MVIIVKVSHGQKKPRLMLSVSLSFECDLLAHLLTYPLTHSHFSLSVEGMSIGLAEPACCSVLKTLAHFPSR